MTTEITTYEQLKKVAKEINEAHELAQQLAKQAVSKMDEGLAEALLCGQRLIEVRRITQGEFVKWMEAHLKFSKSTAYNYIKLAQKAQLDGIEAKSLRQALLEVGAIKGKQAQAVSNTVGNVSEPPARPFFDFSKLRVSEYASRKPVTEWKDVDRVAFKQWYDSEIIPLATIRAALN